MIASIFNSIALIFFAGATVAAFVLGGLVGWAKAEGAGALWRALESALLCLAGGLLARTSVSALLYAAAHASNAGLIIGWGFFFWPGVVDTVAALFGEQLLTAPEALLWMASGVGAFTGMMNGLWRIHRWKGIGVLAFLLDVTWGLAGSTNACLLHLVNFAWAGHPDEPRTGAHHYKSGFRFKAGFAVTLGPVMSNNGHGPGTALYAHEHVHVWQNRAFGPFFTLTYLGWIVLFFIPGLIAGRATGDGAWKGVEQLCYFNNPWEAWAYRTGYHHGGGARTSWGRLVWNDGIVLVFSLIYFGGVIGLSGLIVSAVWL